MTEIRFAKVEEFTAIVSFNPQFEEIKPEKVKDKIRDKEIIVAIRENNIVGIIGTEYIWTLRPYIDTLYVHEEHRRQTVAKKLLEFLELYLREQNYTYLYSSAEETADISKNWHEKMGFTECGKIDALNLPDKTAEVFYFKEL